MMHYLKKISPDSRVALWLVVWLIINLLQSAFTELADDEAYYHMFAQNLAWGYFDHPPMTALLVWLGELIFDGELGLRFCITLLQPLYLWILWRLIRPADVTTRDASLFVVISAATLMLQLYGFVAVPDASLLMSAALFLLVFKSFAAGRAWSWLWLGVAMAAMAYSKYHGALVVVFALAVNWRLLLRPTLYLSGVVAGLLLIPHLVWQYNHDWASFAYHLSGRNGEFDWSDVGDFAANMLVVFNPFFVPLYVKAWRSVRSEEPLLRALRWLPVLFIGFFLLTSLRGYVQPQWVIVSIFGLNYLLFTYVRRHPRTRRYVMRTGLITIALVALLRLEMVFNPIGLRFEIFNNKESYGRIAEVAAGRPVIFSGGYSVAAKYNFYTGGEAYCHPSIDYRTHHWQFRNDDTNFAGRDVLLEAWGGSPADSTQNVKVTTLANGDEFHWIEVSDFHPLRNVDISFEGLPARVTQGEDLTLSLTLHNPYPYAVEVGGATQLVMIWKQGRFDVEEFETSATPHLAPNGSAQCVVVLRIPERLAAGDYNVGFALRRAGYTHWFNGKSHPSRVLDR